MDLCGAWGPSMWLWCRVLVFNGWGEKRCKEEMMKSKGVDDAIPSEVSACRQSCAEQEYV